MKRLIIIAIIVFIPFSLFTQNGDSTSTESFLQELVNVLNADSARASVDEKKKAEDQLDSTLAPIIETIENNDNDKAHQQVKEAVLPAPNLPETADQKSSGSSEINSASSTENKELTKNVDDLKAPVVAQDIKIGGDEESKKEKKEKKVREKKERIFKPYIIPAENPKNRAQRKYLKILNKQPKRRQRLMTYDNGDIIFSRHYRSAANAVENPSYLGVRAEKINSFSIIPINTIDIDIKTSTRPLVIMENYLSDGQTLDTNFVDELGENGLSLPVNVSFPTLLNLKLSGVFGSLFLNSGLYVSENTFIPASLFDIVLEGATFDNPYEMTSDLGVNAAAYLKNTVGYGSFIDLPRPFGEIRFGAGANVYAGAFASAELTELELTPSTTGTTARATAMVTTLADSLNFFGDDGFVYGIPDDYLSIPRFTYGFNAGAAWRFKLNRILPFMPNIIKNYIDVHAGVQDIAATLEMNQAYTKEISVEAELGDVVALFGGDEEMDVDDFVEFSERTVSSDTVMSRNIASKMTFGVTYQPIDMILLTADFKKTLSDGIGASDNLEYRYGLYLYPVNSFAVYAGIEKQQQYKSWDAGLISRSMNSEISLVVKVYDTMFDIGNSLSGAGIKLNWARYF